MSRGGWWCVQYVKGDLLLGCGVFGLEEELQWWQSSVRGEGYGEEFVLDVVCGWGGEFDGCGGVVFVVSVGGWVWLVQFYLELCVLFFVNLYFFFNFKVSN